MTSRTTLTRAFLWLAVLLAGPLLGAKLFDLLVLAGAWSANPPASLAMMPYGTAWPVDTGVFFIPFSAGMLVAGFGALIAGWRTPWRYRWLLCLPSVGILLLLILTVVAFWPMNAALYYHGIGSPKDTITDAEAIAMARRWVALDWLRVGEQPPPSSRRSKRSRRHGHRMWRRRTARSSGSCSRSHWRALWGSSSGSSPSYNALHPRS